MMWVGVLSTVMWVLIGGVVGVGHYRGLEHFLLDYTSHYTYTEVHIVVSGQDDQELLAAGRRLLLSGRPWTTNVINVGSRSHVLRGYSASNSMTYFGTVRSTARATAVVAPTASGFLKPVFISTMATALDLHRSLNWSVGEEARFVPWLLVGGSMDPLLADHLYFPLDNTVMVALWPSRSGGQRVELWEVYQAASLLPHRTSRVGLWLPPHEGSAAPGAAPGDGQEEEEQQQQDKEEEGSQQEEERTVFPNLNIAPRRTDLTGLHIRCLTESWQPFTDNLPDERGGVTIGGFMGETFHLMSVFFNFTYDCRRAPDGQFGDYEAGKWTGVVGELVAGRGDVIVTALDSTYLRSSVIDFCFPSGDIEYIMVIRTPEADPWSNFTRQLQPATWLACITFHLLTPVLYLFLTSRSPSLATLSLQDSWFTIQTLLLNQGSLSVRGLPRRTFFLTVVMTSWLIITFYTSVLVSHLTVPHTNPPFTDMAGLLRKSTYSLGLQKGNSEVERLRTSRDPLLQEVWSKIVSRDPGNLVATAEEGFQKVLEDRFVFLTERNYYHFLRRGDCTTTALREKVFTVGAGMAVQRDSPLRLMFSYHTLVHHVMGIMDRSRRRHQPSVPSCNSQKVEALGLTPLVTVFIVLAVAAPLATLFLLLERHFSGCSRRHRVSPPGKGAPGKPPPAVADQGTPAADPLAVVRRPR